MSVNVEQIKEKIYKKLPDILPEVIKTVILHIILMLYHISMPPWVMLMKIKKRRKHHDDTTGMEVETREGYVGRRKHRRRRSKR